MRSLADTPKHTAVTVLAIAGPRAFRRRLLEMGVVPGTRITVTNIAPLGCPIELETRNMRLSIRRTEALHISVSALAPTQVEAA